MICVSCGLPISDKGHSTERGNICDRCWNDPNLFFPEKLQENGSVDFLKKILLDDEESDINVPVLRMKQKDIVMYSGKLDAINLLKMYAVFGFEEKSLSGYQRDVSETQVDELSEYILNCPVAVMPGLFISIRGDVIFTPNSENTDFGTLSVPLKKGSLWVIDGQHRLGGFEKLLSDVGDLSSSTEKIDILEKYEIPITLVDSKNAISFLAASKELDINESDIERLAFFIINKTQRRLSPSLKDTLQYCISRVGIEGIPAIDKELWRTNATAITIELNLNEASPWYQKINISGQRGLNRAIQLNSFVSSLSKLYKNDVFVSLSQKQKIDLIINYWNNISALNRKFFSEDGYNNYIITKALGVYTLNLLLLDYIKLSEKDNYDPNSETKIEEFVNKINGFDWNKESSPLIGFGGMKGVYEARLVLLDYMGYVETMGAE